MVLKINSTILSKSDFFKLIKILYSKPSVSIFKTSIFLISSLSMKFTNSLPRLIVLLL